MRETSAKSDSLKALHKGSVDEYSAPLRVADTVRKAHARWQVDELMERKDDADMAGAVIM